MSNGSKSRNSLVSFVRNYREAARQESMKQRRKQAFQPMLDDKLEDRRLMAVTASVSANKLTVLMDPTDTATISFSSGQLNIGGVSGNVDQVVIAVINPTGFSAALTPQCFNLSIELLNPSELTSNITTTGFDVNL